MSTATRRLPGIRVDAAPPPAAEALPRMDVAVFAGFAATGPLHLPVVVESVTQYAAVFGPDARLAWDAARGERVQAYLGPAVRAFFANGGRRCWVIRVARSAASEALRRASADIPVATANLFAVPGVLSVGADGVEPATASARCEGSWSDGLRVAAALSRPGFAVELLAGGASPPSPTLAFRTRFSLRAGDLVELGDGETSTYAVVDAVRAAREPGGPYEVEAAVCAAFARIGEEGSPPAERSGTARVHGFGGEVAATLSSPAPDRGSGAARLRFDEPMPVALERGHWARWSGGGETVWLRMDEVDREPAFAGSPPAVEESMVAAVAAGPAWRELEPVAPAGGGVLRAALPTLDLRVTGGRRAAHLAGIGLAPLHPAAWWEHETDADFYLPRDPMGPQGAEHVAASDEERFPLSRAAGPAPVAWIPLGVEPLWSPALAPLPQAATALERDGLSAFGADLFLDPELAAASLHVLPELADGIRFLRADPRPLLGVHAALSVGRGGLFNEASLLAVPDAVHLGWARRPVEEAEPADPKPAGQPPHWGTHRGPCAAADGSLEGPDFGVFLDCGTRVLDPPVLFEREDPVPPGAYRLRWSDSEPGAEYALVEATRPDFDDAREVYRGPETEHAVLNQREGVFYYQAFARRGDDRSAGSNAIAVRVRGEEWVQNPASVADEEMEAEWLAVHRAALRLAAASGDLFAALAMPRHFRTEQALRYAGRLRAVNEPPAGAEPGAFGYGEARAPSYGALYFPWLHSDARLPAADPGAAEGPPPTVRTPSLANRPPTVVPPDGAALGVLARRASERGAWVAPANQPLRDVVALTPAVPADDWQRLQDAQVNLVRSDPRGFLALAADTLAHEPELRPINVRRLLTLLRRLALRRGHSYVFEPHGPVLRRAVQRGFDLLLADLFRRGAFVGATPAQSYRVVTDDTVNTPQGVDAGRLVVELRVAPSVPLAFIAVRLAQSGARFSVSEEL
ncbi:MAG TPA: hypothetical protein VHG08_11755 [Longimicrobium sp.]|nr:hypothetical protein [Longimicrobium sp.]